jgi:type II secretion system protein H
MRDTGHTLIELIIVFAIIGIMAAVAVPNLVQWAATRRVHLAAREVAADLQLARLRAITLNTDLRVNFDPAQGTYKFERATGPGTWQTTGPFEVDKDLRLLHPGVEIVSVSANPVIFQPPGIVNAGTEIILRNAQNRQQTITVSKAGRVAIKD